MVERLPKLIACFRAETFRPVMLLMFDQELTEEQQLELKELVALKFAGQSRRDPKAPQTKPPEPGT